ncbi:MAG: hypothetical protein M0R03_13170, partial [Novosphingobium sp.]|nr:hypothetical protein [Novosphingobium sp.]
MRLKIEFSKIFNINLIILLLFNSLFYNFLNSSVSDIETENHTENYTEDNASCDIKYNILKAEKKIKKKQKKKSKKIKSKKIDVETDVEIDVEIDEHLDENKNIVNIKDIDKVDSCDIEDDKDKKDITDNKKIDKKSDFEPESKEIEKPEKENKAQEKIDIKQEDIEEKDKKSEQNSEDKDKKRLSKLPIILPLGDSEIRAWCKFRMPEFFYGKNLTLLNNDNPSDRIIYFRHVIDLNLEYKFVNQEKAYDIIFAKMNIRNKGIWGDPESIAFVTANTIKFLDSVMSDHSHALPRHIFW